MNEIETCCVGGHNPSCVKCEHCGKWVQISNRVASVNEITDFLTKTHYDLNVCGGECDCTNDFCAKALHDKFIIIKRGER